MVEEEGRRNEEKTEENAVRRMEDVMNKCHGEEIKLKFDAFTGEHSKSFARTRQLLARLCKICLKYFALSVPQEEGKRQKTGARLHLPSSLDVDFGKFLNDFYKFQRKIIVQYALGKGMCPRRINLSRPFHSVAPSPLILQFY